MSNKVVPLFDENHDRGQTRDESRINVAVIFGPNEHEFERTRGETVQSITADGLVKQLVGFTGKETVYINGRLATGDQVLQPGDRLEYKKKDGTKGKPLS